MSLKQPIKLRKRVTKDIVYNIQLILLKILDSYYSKKIYYLDSSESLQFW